MPAWAAGRMPLRRRAALVTGPIEAARALRRKAIAREWPSALKKLSTVEGDVKATQSARGSLRRDFAPDGSSRVL
jgi:hypothetical protein